MTKPTIVTIAHVRAAGLCVHGTRTWFARHGLDFREFLRHGIDPVKLPDDAMVKRVVEIAATQRAAGDDR